MASLLRNKTAVGGALGLVLLAAAFGWRWMPPETRAGLAAWRPFAEAPAARGADPGAVTLAATRAEATPTPVPSVVAEPPTEEASLAELSAEIRAEVDDALARAEVASAAGRLVEPPTDNALYWFDAALELDPGNRAAAKGREALLARITGEIDALLDAGDAEGAATRLAALRQTPLPETERARLASRLEQLPRVTALLREGARRMVAGERYAPEGASALDSYRAARALDPRNADAARGLAEIEESLAAAALAAASEDRYDEAERLLDLAAADRPDSPLQLDSRGRVQALRLARIEGLLARAATALDARNSTLADDFLARAAALGASRAQLDPLRARVASARLYDHLAPGQRFTDPFVDRTGRGPVLVVMPVGSFRMGSPRGERGRREHEGPQHEVAMGSAFALGATETTVAEFRRFVDATGWRTTAERLGQSSYYDEPNGRISSGNGVDWRMDYRGQPARDTDPVVHVSFEDAQAYATWLSERTGRAYRLPSEAEFEYALRAGSSTAYWWGDGRPPRLLGNFTGDGDRSPSKRTWTRAFPRYSDGHWGPAPAASFPANPFGLHDLNGNVSEWVEDCWHDSYRRAPLDGSAWVNRGCDRRVVRGGSWGSAPAEVRAAFRTAAAPTTRSARIGFRVARAL